MGVWFKIDLLMQFQADILEVPVIRPRVTETTALGAAYAAGLASGLWSGLQDLKEKLAGGQNMGTLNEPNRKRSRVSGLEKGRKTDV